MSGKFQNKYHIASTRLQNWNYAWAAASFAAICTPNNHTIGQNHFQNQGENIVSSIIGSYKPGVTIHASRLEFDFTWQPRFHDHVIRDMKSFKRIQNYIINNPQN